MLEVSVVVSATSPYCTLKIHLTRSCSKPVDECLCLGRHVIMCLHTQIHTDNSKHNALSSIYKINGGCHLLNKVENINCTLDIPYDLQWSGRCHQNCPFQWGIRVLWALP